AAAKVQYLAKIDFQEVFGYRQCALIIKPPLPAVGQHAPAQAASGHVIDAAQITQHLRRRHALLALAASFLAVEDPVPALRLDDAQPVRKPLPRQKWGGLCLRLRTSEKERVGHIVARLGRK